jgi:hypothetical protein
LGREQHKMAAIVPAEVVGYPMPRDGEVIE